MGHKGTCSQHPECPPWPGPVWEVEKGRAGEEAGVELAHEGFGNEQVLRGAVKARALEHPGSQAPRT